MYKVIHVADGNVCGECGGDGRVFFDYTDRQYEVKQQYHTCLSCGGTGEASTEVEIIPITRREQFQAMLNEVFGREVIMGGV